MNRKERKIELQTVLIGDFEKLVHLYQNATHKLPFGVLAGEMIETILEKEFPSVKPKRSMP